MLYGDLRGKMREEGIIAIYNQWMAEEESKRHIEATGFFEHIDLINLFYCIDYVSILRHTVKCTKSMQYHNISRE